MNYVNDIEGSSPKDRGSMPAQERIRQEQMKLPRVKDYAKAQRSGSGFLRGNDEQNSSYAKVQMKDFNNLETNYEAKFAMSPQIN